MAETLLGPLDAPNYTQIPNYILDNLYRLDKPMLKVLLVICRQTFGWHREKARLSTSFLVEATGLAKQSVTDAVRQLVSGQWVEKSAAGDTFEYRLLVGKQEEFAGLPTRQGILPGRMGGAYQVGQEGAYQVGTNKEREVKKGDKESAPDGAAPPKPQKRQKLPVAIPDIPEDLVTPEVAEAWTLWKQHRAEIRKPLTPTAANEHLRSLRAWGAPKWVAAVRRSISNQWQGLFEEKVNGRVPDNAPPLWKRIQVLEGEVNELEGELHHEALRAKFPEKTKRLIEARKLLKELREAERQQMREASR